MSGSGEDAQGPQSALGGYIRALPKAELHVHLEGSITPELALRLARRHGLRLPGAESGADGLRRAYVFKTFRDFLRLYVAVSRCVMTAQDISDIVLDLARRQALQGVRYAEVTFTPITHRVRGIAAEALWEGLARGRARANTQHGVTLRWVFDVVRSTPGQAEATVDFCLGMEARDTGSVVGMGVGGPEADHYPMEEIGRAFDRARGHGFKSLPHAGENAGAASMWTAIRRLRADRIGHGVRCLEDPALVEHLRAHQLPLEVCPSSNLALRVAPSWQAHPLPQLLEQGVAVSLGSDDPPMFGTTLALEYERCARAFGWDAAQLRALARASVEHSFAPEDLRNSMLEAQAAVPPPSLDATD